MTHGTRTDLACLQSAVSAMSMTNCPALGECLDNMRAIQSTAALPHWTQQERDEWIEQQLFGRVM